MHKMPAFESPIPGESQSPSPEENIEKSQSLTTHKFAIERVNNDPIVQQRKTALESLLTRAQRPPEDLKRDLQDDLLSPTARQSNKERPLIPDHFFDNQALGAELNYLQAALVNGVRSPEELLDVATEEARSNNKQSLVALKVLGSRLVQLHGPRDQQRWGSLPEADKRITRLGEMFMLSAEMAALSLPDSLQKLSPDKAAHFARNFSRYAQNEDIPEEFSKALKAAATRAVSRANATGTIDTQPRPTKENRALILPSPGLINEKDPADLVPSNPEEHTLQQSIERRKENLPSAEAVNEEQPRSRIISYRIISPDNPASSPQTRSENQPADIQESYAQLSQLSQIELAKRLDSLINERRKDDHNPRHRQAQHYIEQWRDTDNEHIDAWLESHLRRYSVPYMQWEPQRSEARDVGEALTQDLQNKEYIQREQKRLRYLGIMRNELGYGDTVSEGGWLNRWTSQITERWFARGVISKFGLFGRQSQVDILQARDDVIQSLHRAAAHQKKFDEASRMIFREVAKRLYETTLRDLLWEKDQRPWWRKMFALDRRKAVVPRALTVPERSRNKSAA